MTDNIIRFEIPFIGGKGCHFIRYLHYYDTKDDHHIEAIHDLAKKYIAECCGGLKIMEYSLLTFSYEINYKWDRESVEVYTMTIAINAKDLNLWKLKEPEKYNWLDNASPHMLIYDYDG